MQQSVASDTRVRSKLKGTGFRGYRNYLEKRVSPHLRRAVIDALDPEVRELLTGDSLLVSAMYPIELQHRFLEAFARVVGGRAEEHLRAMGREVAETDLRGVYRVFIWAASVAQTLSVLTKVWTSYFSTGYATFRTDGPGRGTSTIRDPFQHPLHHPIVAGYIEVAIRLAGGKRGSVEYHVGAEHTVVFSSTWE